MVRASRLLCIAAAVTALGVTACGGEKIAIKTVVQTKTQGDTTQTDTAQKDTGDTGTGEENRSGPQNTTYRKKFDAGDCGGVESATIETLNGNPDSTQAAEAHLYHALAVACLGHDASAELDQAEASRALLSSESVEILDRVKAEGVPRDHTEVRDLLPRKTLTG